MNKTKLDTLLIFRGLLALSVVVWHFTGFNQNIPAAVNIPGRTAVWIFFGISGYVISYGFLKERYLLNAAGLKAFYINRFLRIYPLFLLLSFLAVVSEYFSKGNFPIGFSDIPAQVLMLQFNHEYVLNGVFWTLGIEVQFYIIAPLIVMLFIDKYNKKFLFNIAVYFLLLAQIYMTYYFLGWSFDGRSLLSNLPHFFIGMIGCKFVLANKERKFNRYFLGAIILLLICFTNYLYQHSVKYYWTLGMVLIDLVIFFAILLHSQLRERVILPANIVLRVLTFLGTISYGIYGWHAYLVKYVPFLEANLLFLIAATILTAFISFKLFEKPILNLKIRESTIEH